MNFNIVGVLCARDYKGVGSQLVQEGKVIVEYTNDDGVGLSRKWYGGGWHQH